MKYLLLIGALTFSFSSFAGPGGGHSHGHSHSHSKKSISKDKTGEVGRYHVERLAKAGKIDTSWKSCTLLARER